MTFTNSAGATRTANDYVPASVADGHRIGRREPAHVGLAIVGPDDGGPRATKSLIRRRHTRRPFDRHPTIGEWPGRGVRGDVRHRRRRATPGPSTSSRPAAADYRGVFMHWRWAGDLEQGLYYADLVVTTGGAPTVRPPTSSRRSGLASFTTFLRAGSTRISIAPWQWAIFRLGTDLHQQHRQRQAVWVLVTPQPARPAARGATVRCPRRSAMRSARHLPPHALARGRAVTWPPSLNNTATTLTVSPVRARPSTPPIKSANPGQHPTGPASVVTSIGAVNDLSACAQTRGQQQLHDIPIRRRMRSRRRPRCAGGLNGASAACPRPAGTQPQDLPR